MFGKSNINWRMGRALPVLCALLFITALPSAANYAYDGFEIKNMVNGTVQGDVFASYGSNGGLAISPYTTSYNVPTGTVKWARLYVGVWGGNEANTGWVNTTLNGNSLGSVTLGGTGDTNPTYSSGTNAYSSGNGVWMVSYNCTDNVISGSNIAIEPQAEALTAGYTALSSLLCMRIRVYQMSSTGSMREIRT
jgi:subtilase family serine protease